MRRRGQNWLRSPAPEARCFVERFYEANTSFTVWSRGRLLGESDLDYERAFPDSRFGDFIPTEHGEKLMPIITGVSRALLELSRTRDKWEDLPLTDRRDVMRCTTEYGDTKAAEDQFETLELELRGPDGAVIPTSSIGIQDTELLLQWGEVGHGECDSTDAMAEQLSAEELSETERDAAALEEWFHELEDFDLDREPWEAGDWKERPVPRYQIHVELIDEWSIP
jgi:hypothetical protein